MRCFCSLRSTTPVQLCIGQGVYRSSPALPVFMHAAGTLQAPLQAGLAFSGVNAIDTGTGSGSTPELLPSSALLHDAPRCACRARLRKLRQLWRACVVNAGALQAS